MSVAATASDLAFHLERSFTVKGPLQFISNYKFADINHDGVPEVLAQDSAYTVIYSISGDSVVAVIHKDSTVQKDVLFADVNRDGVPDIVQSYVKTTPSLGGIVVVELFDGAHGFQRTVVDTFTTNLQGAAGPGGSGVFTCVDLSRDGFGELVLSVDSANVTNFSMVTWTQSEAGSTYCFCSFPDSLAWKRPFFLTKLDSAVTGSGAMGYFGQVMGIQPLLIWDLGITHMITARR